MLLCSCLTGKKPTLKQVKYVTLKYFYVHSNSGAYLLVSTVLFLSETVYHSTVTDFFLAHCKWGSIREKSFYLSFYCWLQITKEQESIFSLYYSDSQHYNKKKSNVKIVKTVNIGPKASECTAPM